MSRILLIVIFIGTYCLSSFGQKKDPRLVRISYACANKPLNLVLQELSRISGVDIVYSNVRTNYTRKITQSVKDESLIDVLTVILQPYRLIPEIVENVIVINTRKEKEKFLDFIISGVVRNKLTNEVLPNASVYLADRTKGVYANENGFYSFKLDRADYAIVYSYTGFNNDTLRLYLKRDTVINRYMMPEINRLEEVIVKEDLNKQFFRNGEEFISQDKIAFSTALTGEADVIRSINNLAGVYTGADGFGGQSIRGGNTDQNLILFDGIPMQNTGHSFGLVSIFNSDIIQDARLYKTSMPARFSGRLSSILDIKTRNGESDSLRMSLTLSTITSKATVEGPISKGKSSFIVSARRTFADLWIDRVADFFNQGTGTEGGLNYYFGDVSAKLRFEVGENKHLSVLGILSRDRLINQRSTQRSLEKKKFLDQSNIEQNWGNNIASISLDQILGNNRFAKTSIYYSGWKTSAFDFNRNAIEFSASNVTDIYNSSLKSTDFKIMGLRHDYGYQINKTYLLRAGIQFTLNSYNPSFNYQTNNQSKIYPEVISKDDLSRESLSVSIKSNEFIGYAENEFTFSKGSILNVGLNFSRYQSKGNTSLSLQPRVAFNLSNRYSWFTAAVSTGRQYQQALAEDGLGFPTDVWVSSTKFIKPADGLNAATNFGFMLGKSSSVNFGLYYKTMKNIIALGEGQNLIVNVNNIDEWEKEIPRGTGKTYGLEGGYSLSTSSFSLELNGTFGHSTRKFLDINNQKEYEFNLNRRFSSNGLMSFKFSKTTKLNVSVNYAGGARVSVPTGDIVVFEINGQKVLSTIYVAKNSYLFPNNFRTDIGLNMVFKGRKVTHGIYAGIYNITDQKNPVYLKLDRNVLDLNIYEVNQVSLFRILPALSYTLNL